MANSVSAKLPQAVLAAILIAGCSTTPSELPSARLARVSLGMSKDEVAKIMGSPTQAATGTVYEGPHVQSGGFSEIHRYVKVNQGVTNDCVVVYYKGKVTEYGPYVGNLRDRYAVFEK